MEPSTKTPRPVSLDGILRDSATNLVWRIVPEPTVDELLEATALACQKIAEAGITSVHWIVVSENELEIIKRLHAQGKLLIRVNVIVPEVLLKKTVGFPSTDSLMLRVGGVFISVDGYLDSETAVLFQPYSDEPNNNGKLLCTEQTLAASVAQVLAADLQPVIHAMGDKAVDTALNVIEQASKRTLSKSIRFRIGAGGGSKQTIGRALENPECRCLCSAQSYCFRILRVVCHRSFRR